MPKFEVENMGDYTSHKLEGWEISLIKFWKGLELNERR